MQEKKKIKGKISSLLKIQKPLKVEYKGRHHSFSCKRQESTIEGAFQFIDELLRNVDNICGKKEQYVGGVMELMGGIDAIGQSYFELRGDDEVEVINVCDEEPQADNMKHLNVVPSGHIQSLGIVKVPAYKGTVKAILPEQETIQYKEQEKHRRETLITKLKKDHVKTLHTKYASEAIPLIEERVYFKEEESEQIQEIRKAMGKKQMFLKKQSLKKNKNWHDESPTKRREQKLLTVHKKKRDYIDRIDPTNQSFTKTNVTKDEIKHQKRGSLFYMDPFQLMAGNNEEAVTAKQTNFSAIALTNKTSKEKLTFNASLRTTTKENIKLPPLGLDGDELNKKVVHSVHMKAGVRLKTLECQDKKARMKNSLSVSSNSRLPLLKGPR